MHVIHFTEGATDPLLDARAQGARFVPLADGSGESHVACLHLTAGGRIPKLPIGQACALLVVQGHLVFTGQSGLVLELSPGVGVVMHSRETCALESRDGAIMILVKGQHLQAHESGISTPRRIMGQRWPGEAQPAVGGRL